MDTDYFTTEKNPPPALEPVVEIRRMGVVQVHPVAASQEQLSEVPSTKEQQDKSDHSSEQASQIVVSSDENEDINRNAATAHNRRRTKNKLRSNTQKQHNN